MRCDKCGCEFKGHAKVGTYANRYPLVSEIGIRKPIVRFVMCPECAAARAKTKRTFIWAFLIAVGILGLIALIEWR